VLTDKNSKIIGDYCILKEIKRSSCSLFWCTVPEFVSKHWVNQEKTQSVYAMSWQRLEACITRQIHARSVTLWLPHNPCKPYLFSSRRSAQIPLGSPEIEHVTTLQCFNPLMRLKANKSTGNWSARNKGAFSVVAKIIWTHSCLERFCQTVARETSTFVDFILLIIQLDAQILFYSKFISSLYMFRAHVLIVRRSKLYYTASGIITPIGIMIPEAVQYNFDLLTMNTWCSKHVEAWNELIV